MPWSHWLMLLAFLASVTAWCLDAERREALLYFVVSLAVAYAAFLGVVTAFWFILSRTSMPGLPPPWDWTPHLDPTPPPPTW